MNRKKRFGESEINLTPLLDVLFSILFIVMLGSAANEARTRAEAKAEVEAMQEQVENVRTEMSNEAEELKLKAEEMSEQARIAENRLEDYAMYRREGLIVSVQNTIEDTAHVLKIFVNEDEQPYETIQLGTDLTEYTRTRANDIISELISRVDNAPIFVVFHCDTNLIFENEFKAVNEALSKLQDRNKEIFYKIIKE